MEYSNAPGASPQPERQKIEKEEAFAAVLTKIEEEHPEFFFDLGKSIHETVLWNYDENKFTFDSELRPDIMDDILSALKKAGLFKD